MKLIKFLLVCAAAAGLFAQSAKAEVTLSLTPIATTGTVSVGSSIQYYLTISGLQSADNPHTALSAFGVTLDYDPSVISVSLSSFLTSFGVTETSDGMTSFSDSSVSGELYLFAASSNTTSSDYNAQSSSLTLATVTVTGVGEGSSSLSIDPDASATSLSDQNGNTIAIGSTSDVTVTAVPEPSATVLMGLAGVAALMRFRRRGARLA